VELEGAGHAACMQGCEIHTKILVETLPPEMNCFYDLASDGRVTLLEDI